MRQVNENMTPDEQVAFAWKHRAYFNACKLHNFQETARRYRGDMSGKYRNAWIELAELPGVTR